MAGVLASIESVLAPMGGSPAAYVRRFDPRADGAALAGLVHRWASGRDLVAFVWTIGQMLGRAGSIERFFLEGLDAGAADVEAALESFGERARALDVTRAYGRRPARPGVWFFFPRPSTGSACKRLNLYLRWMVRRDEIDMGVWAGVAPARLVVPLDTHVIRVGRCLGLTRCRTPGLGDGGRDHRVAARARPGRSGPLRLLAVPPGHDERVRLPHVRRRDREVPAARPLPPRRPLNLRQSTLARAPRFTTLS